MAGRVAVREVRGETFVKLMEMLVVWGRGLGRRTTWTGGGGADASCQDLPGGREIAPTCVLAV